MDSNKEEDIDANNSIVQRIIINNFEIKQNNFITKDTLIPESNDITIMAMMENYTEKDDKFMTNSSSDFTKMIEEEINDDIIKDSKYVIFCKLCRNVLAIEGKNK